MMKSDLFVKYVILAAGWKTTWKDEVGRTGEEAIEIFQVRDDGGLC